MDAIYLDHNASTPVRPEVIAAMTAALTQGFGNPSSAHPYGKRARALVEQARAEVAALIGADPDEIVFTSGGTEANNLALLGGFGEQVRGHVVTSAIEHPAVEAPLEVLERRGFTVERVGIDGLGRIDPADVRACVRQDTALISVMLAHNETGVIQPVGELAGLGPLLHTDAAQAVGKIPVDVRALGVDLLTVAGHKLYAPKGVGALFVRRGVRLQPILWGASHERGLRPGTENVPGIVGLGEAARLARIEGAEVAKRLEGLRDRLERLLMADVPGLRRSGPDGGRLPNTLHVRFPGVRGADLLARCPEIAASTGSACHDGHPDASAVLLAMGVPPAEAAGAVRLSLGVATTGEEVDRAGAALVRAWRACRAR